MQKVNRRCTWGWGKKYHANTFKHTKSKHYSFFFFVGGGSRMCNILPPQPIGLEVQFKFTQQKPNAEKHKEMEMKRVVTGQACGPTPPYAFPCLHTPI